MKKLLSIVSVLILIINVSYAQIPNSGFENWISMGSYENPNLWGTMNNTSTLVGVYTATKGTPGNVGSYYLNLTSKTTTLGVLNAVAVSGKLDSLTMLPKSGFAFNLRPQSFTGKWQHMIYGTTQGAINVVLTKWNSGLAKRDTIASINQTLSGMVMSWAAFSFNFTYQSGEYPDSCIIFAKASGSTPKNLDYLYLDDLAFAGSVAGIAQKETSATNISVYPNPTNETLIIDLNLNSAQNITITILDLNGKSILSENMGILNGHTKQSINISSLPKGSYLIRITEGNENRVEKIVIL